MSPVHLLARPRRWRQIRPLSVAAVCAAAAIAAAGCGSSGGSGSGGATQSGSAGHATSGGATSAGQALSMAASAARKVTSFTATMNISSSGMLSTHLVGTLQEQLKPTLLAHQTFTVKGGKIPLPGGMQTLLTGDAVYLKVGSLARLTGKPWMKIPFSAMKQRSGVNLAPLVRELQGNNPLAQTQMLAAASNVHQIGTATVNGISTTGYAGTLDVAKSLARLGPSLRKLVGPALSATGITTAHFVVWVDAQHQVRKMSETENGSSYHGRSVVTITSINQPVHIHVPPASQVGSMPGL